MPLFLIALVACNNPDTARQKPVVNEDSAEVSVLPPVTEQQDTANYNKQEGQSIQLKFQPDSTTLTATGSLKSAKDRIIAFLPADRKGQLSAILVPSDSKMNIRFSQLVMPDSTMDGPFGQKLDYKLTQRGMYRIIIAPSNMADGKTTGDFMIRLKVD